MNLILDLSQPLAEQLHREAAARRVPPEQVARELLGHALHQLARERSRAAVNHRRGKLIRLDRERGLSPEEIAELDRLQAEIDRDLEPMDRALLASAEQFRQLVEGLPDATP